MRGLLDTSVVLARDVERLPEEAAISAATLAELHFGVCVATEPAVRKARLRRLTEVESRFDALPIDETVARVYGHLAEIVSRAGRRPRTRVMDILIAATAAANEVPLFTRNRSDFEIFESALELEYV